MNLVSNAIKFTDRGEIVVRVERTRRATTTRVGALQRSSTPGIGIPREKQASIFRAVHAGAMVRRRASIGGTGLGLDDLPAARGADGRPHLGRERTAATAARSISS